MFDKTAYIREYMRKRRETQSQESKERVRKYNKQYRKNNPERVKKLKKKWNENNPEYMVEYKKQYYIKNKARILKQRKQYRKENREKIKEGKRVYYEKNREKVNGKNNRWRKNNLEYINKYCEKRRKTDLKYNLSRKMVVGIAKSLKRNKKGYHWEMLVGYTLKELIKRLKKTMPKGYTWQDYLEGKLHIDHRIPISVFNFTKAEHTDFKRCWALKNLQLLPAMENWKKNAKLARPFQPALKI